MRLLIKVIDRRSLLSCADFVPKFVLKNQFASVVGVPQVLGLIETWSFSIAHSLSNVAIVTALYVVDLILLKLQLRRSCFDTMFSLSRWLYGIPSMDLSRNVDSRF